jgi:ribosome-associated heat shock protein Hsp15
MSEVVERVRLDKWLWAARFFKTRQLAIDAINGGKVHLNGQRTKPGKEVKVGMRLSIHTPSAEFEVEVRVLAGKRRPAAEARTFYEETPESIERRERLEEARRAERLSTPRPSHGKMNKRDRRLIHRFTGKG